MKESRFYSEKEPLLLPLAQEESKSSRLDLPQESANPIIHQSDPPTISAAHQRIEEVLKRYEELHSILTSDPNHL